MTLKYQTEAQQHPQELAWWIALLQRENVRSYLEIGSKFGGALWRVANALPIGSRVTSVDLPNSKVEESSLVACCAALQVGGYDARLFKGDSTSNDIVRVIGRHAPFDACLIDANHTLPYIRKDFENYGPMCRIVAFHDIGWLPRPAPSNKMPIEVPQFWNEIKSGYRHEEIKLSSRDNGIGVLWRC